MGLDEARMALGRLFDRQELGAGRPYLLGLGVGKARELRGIVGPEPSDIPGSKRQAAPGLDRIRRRGDRRLRCVASHLALELRGHWRTQNPSLEEINRSLITEELNR